MNEIVKVKEKEVVVLEWRGQRVVTTAQLADIYESTETQIKQNYGNNEKRFNEGEHFYFLKGDELKEFKRLVENFDLPFMGNLKYTSQLYLWTRRGASRHCKMLGTEEAWEQFDALEENYYNPKKLSGENAIDQILENPDFGIKLLTAYKEEKEKTKALQTEIQIKNQIIGELKPKADYTNIILNSKALVTITQIAKDYGMTGTKMNELLHELKIQYKESEQWLLYRKYQDKGYTHSKTISIERSNGMTDIKMHTKWTQKGRLFLYQTLKENGYLPIIEQNAAI